VSISDTGTGIAPQDAERVFNPLFTTKSGGMGMGLSICRSIIDAHDGQLWVVPNAPNGAVFQFALRPSG
jgi:signal transduction histidine kinase